MKKVIIAFLILGVQQIVVGQNDLSTTQSVVLGPQGYIGNSLRFQGWGETHFIRNESIDNADNGKSRLRMYLEDDWAYDQGFEIIAKHWSGTLRSLLYIPGDGSQAKFFSGASFGGKVGIGSINPDEKLTVKGKIHAEEVRVDLQVPADYVFEKYYTGSSKLKTDYVMPTLAEIEKFTKENNHLPSVPSAQEIKDKGLQLGEMNNILLQKIEELTLYIIEQNKRIETLEERVNSK